MRGRLVRAEGQLDNAWGSLLRAGKTSTPIRPIRAASQLFVLQLLLFFLLPIGAAAQLPPEALRLMPGQPRPEVPVDGEYLAGDDVRFTLRHREEQEELRFEGSGEIFYLSIEPAPLGGRAFKYDTGDVALQVTGWGGITLYTREVRGGMPAERVGDAPEWEADAVVAPEEIKTFAAAIASQIRYESGLTIGFKTDWNALARSDQSRALASEAMRNVARAIERGARSRNANDSPLAQFDVVRITAARESGASLSGRRLTVRYAPARGVSGRPSSLAIAKAISARP